MFQKGEDVKKQTYSLFFLTSNQVAKDWSWDLGQIQSNCYATGQAESWES